MDSNSESIDDQCMQNEEEGDENDPENAKNSKSNNETKQLFKVVKMNNECAEVSPNKSSHHSST